MSEETDVNARMMMTEVEQMEEGKVESPESGRSPKSPTKLIIDEEVQEREKEISWVGRSPGGSFPSLSSSHEMTSYTF